MYAITRAGIKPSDFAALDLFYWRFAAFPLAAGEIKALPDKTPHLSAGMDVRIE